MSEKRTKAKKEVVEDEAEEQVQEQVVKRKKKVEEKVEADDVAPVADSSTSKKKKKPVEEVIDDEEPEHQDSKSKPKKGKTPSLVLDGTSSNANDGLGVDDMEAMAQKSARTPRAGMGPDSPRVETGTPTADPDANSAHMATTQTDAERKKIEPLPRLYVNVTEAKGLKPGAYYVSVNFGVKGQGDAWTSDVTKKSTTWENKGRLLAIPKGATQVTITLHAKGMIGDILDKSKGEAVWDLKSLMDGYPHQPWAPILKKTKQKCELRVQLMYLPENVSLDGDEFITPLHALIRKSKLDLLARAVDDIFADLKLTDADGRTPLHLAVQLNKSKFVKLLIKNLKGEGGDLVTPKKETALHFAAKYASADIASQLLKAGINVNAVADGKRTALHYGANSGNVEVVQVIATAEGVSLNAQDKEGNTPLSEALISDRTEVVQALVELGADVYVENGQDLTVWEVAQRKDMVGTDARKAFMGGLGVHDAREFPLRQKFPKKFTAKGAKCEMDYEESTQFSLTVSGEAVDVHIILTTDDVTATPGFVSQSGFALIKSDQGVHNEVAISRDTIAFSGNRAVSIKLEPNFFYNVVPYAKTEDGVRDYTLVVLAPKKKNVTITQLKPWAHQVAVEGVWEGQTAGGAQPAPTWVDNPHYEVTMPEEDDVKFHVLLTQEENDPELRYVDGDDHKKIPYDHPVGFYVCDRGGVKVLEQVEKWTNSRDVHQEFTMDFSQRNHVCIIPTMHQPGTTGPFTLRVFCDHPVSISAK
jgi:ankyrin repeat protein